MKIKQYWEAIIFLIAVLILPSFLQAQLQHDKKYKFSINIPADWSKKSYKDGTDKVFEYYSPDQNAAIQLRTFEADERVTTDLLVQVYEQSMLPKGYSRESLDNHVSANGIPGKQGIYQVNYDGNDVILATFYTVQNSIGYVLTAIVPNVVADQKGDEVKAIARSFQIDGFHAASNKQSKTTTGAGTVLGGSTGKAKNEPEASETGFTTLALDDIQVEFSIPKTFKIINRGEGQTIWSDSKGDIKMVIQTIDKSTGKTANSISGDVAQQVHQANGKIKKDSHTTIDGLYVKQLTYEVNEMVFTYLYTDAPQHILALGFVSSVQKEDVNRLYFHKSLLSLRQINKASSGSTGKIDKRLVGSYKFVGRSDGKDLLNYWNITLNLNGTFNDEHQLKEGNYVSKNSGNWSVEGDKLTLTIPTNYGNGIQTVYTIQGNRLVRKTEGGVFFYFEK